MEQFVEGVAEAHKVYRLLRRYYSAQGISIANGGATGEHEIPSLYIWECALAIVESTGLPANEVVGLKDMLPDIEDVIRDSYLNKIARGSSEIKSSKLAHKKANLLLSRFK